MAQTLLTISMLVSGREETTEKCIQSLAPIMNEVDTELILVDTGCGSDLRKKIEKYATKIIDFTWCNDFSKARNVGLEAANGQWFLYLDDDEWFLDVQDIIVFFKSAEYKEFASASYIQRNYLDMEGNQYTDTRVGRMACITPQLHFESKIHEFLTPIRGKHKNLSSMVEHYGYVYDTDEAKMAHFRRNQTLLEEMIGAEPQNLRWRLQLLQEYRAIDDYERMYRLGEEGIAMLNLSDAWNGNELQMYIGSFYAAQILSMEGRKDYERMYELCQMAMQDSRNTKLCNTFINEMSAKSCFYRGLAEQSYERAEKQYQESDKYVQAYLADCEYFSSHQEEFSCQQIAPFVGECLDDVKQKEIYSIGICNGLKMNSTENLALYIDALQWTQKHVYVFEEIVDILVDAVNAYADRYRGMEIPSDTTYEVYAKTLRIMNHQHALWAYFCEVMEEKRNRGIDVSQGLRLISKILPDAIETTDSTDELEQLASQVKQQIQMLIANGMKEQARVAIHQVEKLLPNDQQLKELEQMCK